jgi:CTP synthase (UTP-ammonia lyase)
VFSAFDNDRDPRIAELPTHPFFLATLFQPELAGDPSRPHPIVQAFARATARHSNAGRSAAVAQRSTG